MRKSNTFLMISIGIIILFVTTQFAAGQESKILISDSPDFLLEGRHSISIHVGMLNQYAVDTDISTGGVSSGTSANGFLGSLIYSYWVNEEWAVEIAAGVIDAESSTSVGASGVTSRSASVVPLLFGMSYSPIQLSMNTSIRPYGTLAIGPYFGSATNADVGLDLGSETVFESVLGMRLRIGTDIFLSRRIRAGIALGYHLVSDFNDQIGNDQNYSGLDFTFGFGILFGNRK